MFVPKFKLAKIKGFEGEKVLERQVVKNVMNGEKIKLTEYFEEELNMRYKDQ
jgi:hypothetical protein